MRKYLLIGCLLSVLSACSTSPTLTQTVAFCNSFAGTVQKMALLNSMGNLSATEITTIDSAIAVIGPYCTSELIESPTTAVVSALDQMLLIQIAKL